MTDTSDHQAQLAAVTAADYVYPAARFHGRGVVICAGGARYFTNAYVCARILREQGCTLPIEFWHLAGEMTDEMRDIVRPFGVRCVDASEVRKTVPARILNGWELKPYAIINSSFEEVLLLDADNVCVTDPTFLFDTPQFKETGAIFWPDYGRLGADRQIWSVMGIDYRDEPEFESGQIVVSKRQCWRALQVTMHLNEWSDFYYRHIHGDKETFHMAWRKIEQPYAMPERGIYSLAGTMCQHDFDGRRIFQHRNMRKWQLNSDNAAIDGFLFEDKCLEFLSELRQRWSVASKNESSDRMRQLARQISEQRYYTYTRVGYDFRPIELLADGKIYAGSGAIEQSWSLHGTDDDPKLAIWHGADMLADLRFGGCGMLHGQWLRHEKMPIVLLPNSNNVEQSAQDQFEFFKPRLSAVQCAHSGKRSDTLIVTGATGEQHEQILAITAPKMAAYAKRHGADFVVGDISGSRPPSWLKVACLFQALWDYDRVLWLDADVLICRSDKDIFAELAPAAWHALVLHETTVGETPNCGVWLVTRRLAPVLHEMWMSRDHIDHLWWEQAALMSRIGFVPDQNNSRKERETELLHDTQFLDAEWNHHPRHCKNSAAPRFRHITFYEDRLAELTRLAAELEEQETQGQV